MTKLGELAGRTLAGRYEVLDLVGSGGMGEVYRARDRELDDLIALCVEQAAASSPCSPAAMRLHPRCVHGSPRRMHTI